MSLGKKAEIERYYRQEIQTLCKTLYFEAINPMLGIIDKHLLENIIKIAFEKASLISSMVLSVRATN